MMVDITESSDYNGGTPAFNILGNDVNSLFLKYLKRINLEKISSRKKMKERTNGYSASQVSYNCYRRIYYSMVNPRPAHDDLLGTFTIGDIIDGLCKEIFRELGGKVDFKEEYRKTYFNNMIDVTGTPDVQFPELVIEVKSVSPFAWKYVAGGKMKGEIIIGKPKIQHVRQLNTYLDMLGIEDGVILYVNKDTLKPYCYNIKHDKKLMTETVLRCVSVSLAIDKKAPPDKVKGDECNFCVYKDLCKG